MLRADQAGFLGIEGDENKRHLGLDAGQRPRDFHRPDGTRPVVVGSGRTGYGVKMTADDYLAARIASSGLVSDHVVRRDIAVAELAAGEAVKLDRIHTKRQKLIRDPVASGIIIRGSRQSAIEALQRIVEGLQRIEEFRHRILADPVDKTVQ